MRREYASFEVICKSTMHLALLNNVSGDSPKHDSRYEVPLAASSEECRDASGDGGG